MPQVSVSLDADIIKVIKKLSDATEKPKISFSSITNVLLSTHPSVVKEINKQSKK